MSTNRIFVALLLVLAVMLVACDEENGNSDSIELRASGNIVAQTETFSDFDQIEVNNTFDVTITQGDGFSVELRIDANVQDYVEVRQDGATLIIGLDPDNSYNTRGNITMDAEVTLPALSSVNVSGASSVRLIGIESESAMNLRVSGASHASGDLRCENATITLSGASNADLQGTASELTLRVSGASHARLTDFPRHRCQCGGQRGQ